ncbi:MAG: carboxymuconolactone decarboxylase family protein [Methanocorpusculum sp.]|jgi:alkylhydroperoxidase/carboxymuconolactone decarboxylase family protein YurZ|nr:carboxymuconolactone decarboxylase family protein [Methanocorpusculum sp.]MDD3256661.1 carboxymuconolactone decarboxylase family protein [Methanocorpusculum sp.]MDD4132463.1 carboxymuconolactone decarboxylase family protein [Methanocorpusculum sp.]
MPSDDKKSTCGCHGKMRDLEHNIGHVPVFFKEMAESDPLMHDAVLKLDNYIWSDGSLTRKNKKLIAIGIAAAMRDDHALRAQLAGAQMVGVTAEEVEEALRVAFMLSGMPSYVYGKQVAKSVFHD